jgi:hypothetical protein
MPRPAKKLNLGSRVLASRVLAGRILASRFMAERRGRADSRIAASGALKS